MSLGGTIRSLPRRFRDSLKQEGFVSSVLRAILRPFYRAIVLGLVPLELHLRDAALPGVSLHDVTEKDTAALIALRPEYTGDKIQARLSQGQKCCAIVFEETTVGCIWASTGEVRFEDVGLALPLRPDEVVTYEVYVDPAHRHAGVYGTARRAFDERCWDQGCRRRITFSTLGRRPFGVKGRPLQFAAIRTLHLGPFRRLWVSTYGPQAEYWRERLKELRWE